MQLWRQPSGEMLALYLLAGAQDPMRNGARRSHKAAAAGDMLTLRLLAHFEAVVSDGAGVPWMYDTASKKVPVEGKTPREIAEVMGFDEAAEFLRSLA